jgi:hypothetical protein
MKPLILSQVDLKTSLLKSKSNGTGENGEGPSQPWITVSFL